MFYQGSGINDFQRIGQGYAALFGNSFDFLSFGEQNAASDAFFVADSGGLNGTRLRSFGQNDAFVGFTCEINQVETELCRRQARALTRGQPLGIFNRAARTEVAQTGFLRYRATCRLIRAVEHETGDGIGRSGEDLFGQIQLSGQHLHVIPCHGKHYRRIERKRQFKVFTEQKGFFGIRINAFDNQFFRLQCLYFADQRIKPIVALALRQQSFRFIVESTECLRT